MMDNSQPRGRSKADAARLREEVYLVARARTPVVADGRLDEPVWLEAPLAPFLVPMTLAPPVSATEARMAYDETHLYLAFRCADLDIFATHTERDARLWEEDVVEAFFLTGRTGDPYYEFEFSPRGTIYDALIGRRGAAGTDRRWARWDCEGLRVAARIEGTLNDWRDRDVGYTVEAAIPFASLPTLGGRAPRSGDVWLFNLARYDYSVYLERGVELSASSPLGAVNFHRYEDWRPMRFA